MKDPTEAAAREAGALPTLMTRKMATLAVEELRPPEAQV
jgi:hypothetical protein